MVKEKVVGKGKKEIIDKTVIKNTGIKLIKFSVTNFLSIYETVEIDFSLQPKYEDEYKEKIGDGKSYKGVFKTGNEDIPYYMVLMGLIGKNAAGKTNIFKALELFIRLINIGNFLDRDRFRYRDDTIRLFSGRSRRSYFHDRDKIFDEDEYEASKNGYSPFKLGLKKNEEPTKFEIEFFIGNEFFLYGFSYDKTRILEEYLYKDSIVIFERIVEDGKTENQDKHYLNKYKEINKDLILSRNNAVENGDDLLTGWKDKTPYTELFFTRAMNDNCELFRNIRSEFFDKIDFSLDIRKRISGVDIEDLDEFIKDEKAKKFLLNLYTKLDTGISNLYTRTVEEVRIFTSDGKEKKRKYINVNGMYTIRKNSSGEDVRFDIDDESNGIKSFTYLAVAFYNSLKEGHIIVVDEIESSFHNYVLNYLLKMFYDDKEWNIKGAQLIFTTHNDMIFKYLNLNSIVIVNKTENNQTSINYLIDYADVKNDMDRWELIKNYFDGYYDGVPDIK